MNDKTLISNIIRYKYLFLFLIVNFITLIISRWIMTDGLDSVWYTMQAKAPWTPPAWFFAVAWYTIMSAFAVYLTKLLSINAFTGGNRLMYAVILLLCVFWNAVFFAWQAITAGIFILLALACCVIWISIANYQKMGLWSALMIPFILWSLTATSLNIYSAIYQP